VFRSLSLARNAIDQSAARLLTALTQVRSEDVALTTSHVSLLQGNRNLALASLDLSFNRISAVSYLQGLVDDARVPFGSQALRGFSRRLSPHAASKSWPSTVTTCTLEHTVSNRSALPAVQVVHRALDITGFGGAREHAPTGRALCTGAGESDLAACFR